jgi:hypothetical protein
LRDEFKIRTHTIEIGEGLKLTNKDESNFNTSVLTLGIKESNWKLELKPDEFAIEQVKNGINPWFLDNSGTYNYVGNCGFYNGVLKTTNAYEWDY